MRKPIEPNQRRSINKTIRFSPGEIAKLEKLHKQELPEIGETTYIRTKLLQLIG